MQLQFKNWFENSEAEVAGIQGTVLDFLKDKMEIHDDDVILSMMVGSIDQSLISQLLKRGVFQTADEDLLTDVKNGSITVKDMIDRMAGSKPKLFLPYHQPSSQSHQN
jgi:hypothetical protein